MSLKTKGDIGSELTYSTVQVNSSEKNITFEIICLDDCQDTTISNISDFFSPNDTFSKDFSKEKSKNPELCEKYSTLGLVKEAKPDMIIIVTRAGNAEYVYQECFNSGSALKLFEVQIKELSKLNQLIMSNSIDSKSADSKIKVLVIEEPFSFLSLATSVKHQRSLAGYQNCALSCKLCFKSCSACSNSGCSVCDEGFFLNNGLCFDCVWPCVSCSEAANCLKCLENNYFLESGQCFACSTGCWKCLNLETCLQCNSDGFFLYSGKCLKCSEGCANCENQEICTSCLSNYYFLDSGLCISCQDDYTCQGCQGKNQCSSCASPFYSLSGSCLACGPGCTNCDPLGVCSKCDFDFYLSSGKCQNCEINCLLCGSSTSCNTCSNLFYLASADCFKCPENCITCADLVTCTECSPFFFLSSGKCLRCPDNCWSCNSQLFCDFCDTEYYNDSGKCLKCSENCAFCKNANTCFDCHISYFESSGKCVKCPINCKYCENENLCYECENQLILSLGKCLHCPPNCHICQVPEVCRICEPSYFLSDGLCLNCTSNCKRCVDSMTCVSCSENYFLHLGRCYRCPPGCKVCINERNCLACFEKYYLEGGRCLNCTSDCKLCRNSLNCNQCEESFYIESGLCLKCNPNCEICKSKASCVNCKKGFFLSGSKCLKCSLNCRSCHSPTFCNYCDFGYFISDGECATCPDSCWSCSSLEYCLSCKTGYFFIYGSCINCSPNCLFCYDLSLCIACEEKFTLREGWCFRQSPECETYENQTFCSGCSKGFFLESGECFSCSSQCLGCKNLTFCTECRVSQYLHQGVCLDCPSQCLKCVNHTYCSECRETFYEDSGKCLSCPENCEVCFNSNQCLYCQPTFYLESGKCLKCLQNCPYCLNQTYCYTCQPSFYQNSGNCLECLSSCFNCRNPLNCDSCRNGYYLNDWICETCNFKCSICLDDMFCQQCAEGFYRDCVNCDNRDFLVSECKACHPDCLSCDNGRTCLKCKGSSLVVSDNPGCSCSKGMYRVDSNGNSSCFNCFEMCLTCDNQEKCTECKDPFTVVENRCLCPDSTYFDGMICRNCYLGCRKCRDSTSCDECQIEKTYTDSFCICEHEVVDNVCSCIKDYFWYQRKCFQCERWLKKEDLEFQLMENFTKIIIKINKTLNFENTFQISDKVMNKFSVLGLDFLETKGKEKNEFHLILGKNNKIMTEDLSFFTNKLKSEDKECEVFMSPSLSFKLIEESKRPNPVADIDVIDSFYYSTKKLEKLTINGTRSTGGYLNPLTCFWTLTPRFEFQEISNCLIEIKLKNITQNITIQIDLKVENYFGKVDNSSKNISIIIPEKVTTYLRSVTFCKPSQFCEVEIEDIILEHKSNNLQCEWRETYKDQKTLQGPGFCSSLFIKPFTYSPGTLNLSLIITSYGQEVSISTLEIVMKPESPVIITNKVNGTISALQDFEIDATDSFNPNDPKNKTSDLLFEWTCLVDNEPCEPELKNSSSILKVLKSRLKLKKTLKVTLNVTSKTYMTSDGLSFSGNIVESDVPEFNIVEKTTGSHITKVSLTIETFLECLVDSKMVNSLSWSINVLNKAKGTDPSIRLHPSSLGLSPGHYSLTIEVLTESNSKARFFFDFEVNSPPKKGGLKVVPTEIQELVTEVSLRAEDWEDSDLPLEYMFMSQSPQGSYIMKISKSAEFNSTFSWIGNNQRILCRVFDSFRDFSEISSNITVLKSSFSKIWQFYEKNRKIEPVSKISQIVSNVLVATLEREFFEFGSFQTQIKNIEKFQEIYEWALGHIDRFLQASSSSDLVAAQVVDLLQHLTGNPSLKTNFSDSQNFAGQNFNKTSEVLLRFLEKLENSGIMINLTNGALKVLSNIIRIDKDLLIFNRTTVALILDINENINNLAMKALNVNESASFDNQFIVTTATVGLSNQFNGFSHKNENFSVYLPKLNISSDDGERFNYGIMTSHFLTDPITNSSNDLVSLSIYNLKSNQRIPVKLKDYSIEIEIPVNFSKKTDLSQKCYFFNESSTGWSTKGCIEKKLLKDSVVCACNHLTTFTFGVFDVETSSTYTFKEHAAKGLRKKTLKSTGFYMVSALTFIYLLFIFILTMHSLGYDIRIYSEFPLQETLGKCSKIKKYFKSIFICKILSKPSKKDSIQTKLFLFITKKYFILILQIFFDIMIYDYQYRKGSVEDFEELLENNLTSFNLITIIITTSIVTIIELFIGVIQKLDCKNKHLANSVMIACYLIASIYCFFMVSYISTAFNSVIDKAWIVCIIINLVVDMLIIDPLKALVVKTCKCICRKKKIVNINN